MENNKEPFNGLEEKLTKSLKEYGKKRLWEAFNIGNYYKPLLKCAVIPPPPIEEPNVPADYIPMIWKKGDE